MYIMLSDQVAIHLLIRVGDYTDFFVGVNHARNVYRGTDGYHGGASSIIISSTPILQPHGHLIVNSMPSFHLSKKGDFEVDFSASIGKGDVHSEAVTIEQATKDVFGYVLLNDWSIQDENLCDNDLALGGEGGCASMLD
ncbi:fumarylacetoacetase [Fusarium sp. NRRL 52700]|nr:fumarylacetoacetase [Fusarium sp. NRRL 52700]